MRDPFRPIWTAEAGGERWWRYMTITLSADERAALVALANGQRRHPAEVAAVLVRAALEEKGLLAPEEEWGEEVIINN